MGKKKNSGQVDGWMIERQRQPERLKSTAQCNALWIGSI
jgi:hypothetical protein